MSNETNQDFATLETPMKELETKLMQETDLDELNHIINLFNLNIKRKDILRTSKLNDLQDKVTDQIEERLTKNAGAFSNKDLLDYFKTLQTSIDKSDNNLDNIDTPAIQINQNQLNVNVTNNSSDILDRNSREKVSDAVKAILSKLNTTTTSVIDVDYHEYEEETEPMIKTDFDWKDFYEYIKHDETKLVNRLMLEKDIIDLSYQDMANIFNDLTNKNVSKEYFINNK